MHSTGETCPSHKNTQIIVEASWREKTLTMDQEKEVQWIKNYSELYEGESVLKKDRENADGYFRYVLC